MIHDSEEEKGAGGFKESVQSEAKTTESVTKVVEGHDRRDVEALNIDDQVVEGQDRDDQVVEGQDRDDHVVEGKDQDDQVVEGQYQDDLTEVTEMDKTENNIKVANPQGYLIYQSYQQFYHI